MTRDEFKILVKGMKAVYTQDTFIPDQDAFNVWFALLSDLNYKVATLAIQKYMLTEHFAPTIADIRKIASEVVTPEEEELNELAAWTLVRKACSNGLYGSKEEFANLPSIVQKAVRDPGNLRQMAMMDSKELETVEKSHFIRTYRAEVQRAKEDAKLPPSVKQKIGEISRSAGIGTASSYAQIGGENGEIGNL